MSDECLLHSEKLDTLSVSVATMSNDIKHIINTLDKMSDFNTRIAIIEEDLKSRKTKEKLYFGGLITLIAKIIFDLISTVII